jgi:uncharacterized protein YbaP (TraB family)
MTLKARATGLASALFLAVTVTACSQPDEKAKEPSEGVAVWQVKDEDTTVYLFGTVHILQKSLEWQNATFQKVWDEADTLYLEADVSPQAQESVQALIPQLGLNPAGVTLDSFLSEKGQADLREIAASVNLPVANLQPLRPWLASVLISVQMIIAQGGDPEAGVETILTGLAKEKGTPMRFFETVEQQFRLLASPSDEDSAKALETGLVQIKANPNMFNEIVNSWKTGDIDKMTALIIEGTQDAPETYEALFTTRNKAWAETINQLMADESGTFLVAVGAGHLIGPDSLQVQLETHGHTAERM